jgi:DNA-binding Xre family transcriptional regulator
MRDAISDIRRAVKVELVKRKLTQGELAKRIGITPQHLSLMMQGERSYIPGAW